MIGVHICQLSAKRSAKQNAVAAISIPSEIACTGHIGDMARNHVGIAAKATSVAVYKEEKFSDHAPLTIEYGSV